MPALTEKQQAVLEFIAAATDQNGSPPTLREIAGHFGFRSKTAAADHIRALQAKGLLRQDAPRRARGLRLSGMGRRRPRLDIPIFGAIPAGFPQDRYQDAKGCVSVDLSTLGIKSTPRTFALEVRGDSMIGRHICDGDLVVLEHGRPPRSGDVVAALIDNQSTLKTYVQERGKPPHLQAENPKYPQLHPAAELVIQGVMIALLRKAESQF
ncbi:MAG: transcriptional repressor LexA [Verrucomicrobia bacterium]|jgi:repressor LexA|nr:transcriptional repressor LexA [Verrucomicrobiota bacterium]